jgi:hypothetical protein
VTNKNSTAPTFADALVKLGQHMQANTQLVNPANVMWRFFTPAGFVTGLEIQLSKANDLASWASTLDGATSVAERGKRLVTGNVHGQIGGVPIRVWSVLPEEMFPDELGLHEWDVRVQLQEA